MGSAEASGPTPEEPLILLHAWQLLWVSLRHRWLIFLQYLRWKELTAQAREAAKDQRFFIWCSVRSWTGSAPDPRQRSSWVLGPGCLQSGAWRLLVPAPKTDAGTAMPSELSLYALTHEDPFHMPGEGHQLPPARRSRGHRTWEHRTASSQWRPQSRCPPLYDLICRTDLLAFSA